MSKLKSVLLALMLVLSPFMAQAEESTDKHQGIEITVNINTASAEELATLLKGIGQKKAQQIVEYREANGKFTSAEQLAEVKGIGLSTVEKNRDRIEL